MPPLLFLPLDENKDKLTSPRKKMKIFFTRSIQIRRRKGGGLGVRPRSSLSLDENEDVSEVR